MPVAGLARRATARRSGSRRGSARRTARTCRCPDTSPMIARELTEFFAGFSPDGEPGRAAAGDPTFLSNVNACYARAAGRRSAFPTWSTPRTRPSPAPCSRRAGSRSYTPARPFCMPTTTGRSSSCAATSTSTAACARRSVTSSHVAADRWRRARAGRAATRAGCAPAAGRARAARALDRALGAAPRRAAGSSRRSARAPSGCRPPCSARSRSSAAERLGSRTRACRDPELPRGRRLARCTSAAVAESFG